MFIEFPRGDHKSLTITVSGYAGTIEQIYFTLKDKASSDKALLHKKIGNGIEYSDEVGKYVITFLPEDTDNLEMDKLYGYDCEVVAEKGRLKKTFVGQFYLTKEYTHKKDEV